jgi:hypothetical protein
VKRTIVTLDTGNVIVVEHGADGSKSREFCERGVEVWEVLADFTKAPARIALQASGDQLLTSYGESLEGAIRRTLDVEPKPHLVDRLPDLDVSLIVIAAIAVLAWTSALSSLFGPFRIFG